jgi:hypothetical protein
MTAGRTKDHAYRASPPLIRSIPRPQAVANVLLATVVTKRPTRLTPVALLPQDQLAAHERSHACSVMRASHETGRAVDLMRPFDTRPVTP